jgi:hypothetical protein
MSQKRVPRSRKSDPPSDNPGAQDVPRMSQNQAISRLWGKRAWLKDAVLHGWIVPMEKRSENGRVLRRYFRPEEVEALRLRFKDLQYPNPQQSTQNQQNEPPNHGT